jgi:hypothetical protein
VSETDSVSWVQVASVEFYPPVDEAIEQARARGSRIDADLVSRAARRAVAAWAMAVDGYDTALAAAAVAAEAAHYLLHPVYKRWQVAPEPRVTKIEVWRLEAETEPWPLDVKFQFDGRRRFEDPSQAGAADGEMPFVGMLSLTLTGSGVWRLSRGHVETLDEFLGYRFTSRRETPGEYRKRTGSDAPAESAGRPREFRIVAGFAEDDFRFGSEAEVQVRRETAPDRYEAVELVQPAVHAELTRALGEGDWRPAIRHVDVIELLGAGRGPAGVPAGGSAGSRRGTRPA